MTALNYFKFLKKKINEYDRTAKNPFIDKNYTYNQFKSLFPYTYVWIENSTNDEKK